MCRRGSVRVLAVVVSVGLLVPVALGRAVAAQARPWFSKQFSARMVGSDPADPQKKVARRLYVGASALRVEEPVPVRRVYLYDRGRDRTWILFPDRKQYREVRGTTGWTADLLPKPGGDPCAGLSAPNLTCRRTGTERVNGRMADRWEMVYEVGGKKLVARRWVDRELGIWVRYTTYEGVTFDLVEIRVGPQPASLFQLPKDYRPMTR